MRTDVYRYLPTLSFMFAYWYFDSVLWEADAVSVIADLM